MNPGITRAAATLAAALYITGTAVAQTVPQAAPQA